MTTPLQFSSNSEDFDLDFVAHYLGQESYWAKGRSRDKVIASIHNSFCLGGFIDHKHVAFARVVTDYQTHAYIMDVFVSPEHQQEGIGKALMAALLAEPKLAGIACFSLRTADAQPFYTAMGFKAADNFMVLDRECPTQ